MTHQLTQNVILNQMFDRSMKILEPTFNALHTSSDQEEKQAFSNYLDAAKNEWLSMMNQHLSQDEIDCLIQAFFFTSKIDEQKLYLFNTVFTQRAIELAEEHLG